MPTRPSLSYDVLCRPAARGPGELALGFEVQEAALESAAQLAEHLRELCVAKVDVRWVGARPSVAPFEDGVGVELLLADGGTAWVLLDGRAARALADALALQHLGLRGFGELTGAERGLVEFAALSCLDRHGRGATLRRTLHGRELARSARPERCIALEFEVSVGGGAGAAHALVEARSPIRPLVFDEVGDGPLLVLRLALPALSLSRAEFEALAAGDVVLMGAQALEGFASRAELVTAGGWRVAGAQCSTDDALSMRVRCGALEPRVLVAPTPAPDQVLLTPFLGSRALEREEFERWRAGDDLVLEKRPTRDVDLLASDGARLSGELVRLGGELGVRVCRIDSSPLVCS